MAKKLQLQVPTPCHENWEDMTQTEKGRFCASCQKQVIDFSNKSDREIAMFFKKPSSGSVCGRFVEDQLNRDIEIPKKRIPWLKYFFQFSIPAFLASCDNRMQGKIKVTGLPTLPNVTNDLPKEVCTTTTGVILTEITFNEDTFPSPNAIREYKRIKTNTVKGDTVTRQIVEEDIDTTSSQTTMGVFPDSLQKYVSAESLASIKGKVVDEDAKPVPFATVGIKGAENAVATDLKGLFSIQPKSEWDEITLVVSSVGFNTAEMKITRAGNHYPDTIVLVPMKLQFTGDVVVFGSPVRKTKMQKTIPLLRSVFKDTFFSKFRIYPNPIRPNSTLTIEWKLKDYGDHLLQLFNQSGQLILSKDVYIDEKARLFTMNMPTIIPGNYFLKLTSKATGRSYTEKLIVE
jgi:hypothetical protein